MRVLSRWSRSSDESATSITKPTTPEERRPALQEHWPLGCPLLLDSEKLSARPTVYCMTSIHPPGMPGGVPADMGIRSDSLQDESDGVAVLAALERFFFF